MRIIEPTCPYCGAACEYQHQSLGIHEQRLMWQCGTLYVKERYSRAHMYMRAKCYSRIVERMSEDRKDEVAA